MMQERWHAQPEQTRGDKRQRNAAANDTRGVHIAVPKPDDDRNKPAAGQAEKKCRREFTSKSGHEPMPVQARRAQCLNCHSLVIAFFLTLSFNPSTIVRKNAMTRL